MTVAMLGSEPNLFTAALQPPPPLPPARLPVALLERWMRQHYHNARIDIGSSGVESFSVADLCGLLPFAPEELTSLVLSDSQSLGGTALRAAIAARWLPGEMERVMATHGSSEAIYLLMNTLLAAGDEVLVLDPCYQQLSAIARGVGCRIERWPLRFENGFRPDFDELRGLLGRQTRMVVANFPHNPTGAMLTVAEQRALLDAVAEAGAYLVWDAAFAELTYGIQSLPPAELLAYERAIVIGTLSKAYGLPGLRVGWCMAAPPILERLLDLRDYMTLHLSPLVEWLAERVLHAADRLVGMRLAQAHRNLEVLAAWVEAHRDGVSWVRPQGGVTAFPRFDTLRDTEPLCRRLAERHRVLLVPGNCFGQPAHVRLGFGGPTAELEAGLQQVAACMEERS
jgi:capreomycidine synthase